MVSLKMFAASLVLVLITSCSEEEAHRLGVRMVDETPIVSERIAQLISKDLLEEGEVTQVNSPTGAPVRTTVISPSGALVAGSEPRFSLNLDVPSEISFLVSEQPGEYVFDGEVGLDVSAKKLGAAGRVRVSIWDAEELLGEVTLTFSPSMKTRDNQWTHLIGEEVKLKPGSLIRVKSELVSWQGAGDAPKQAVHVGISLPRVLKLEDVPVRAASEDYPNIVFIVMDTLRQDRLGAYGYENARTPNLDALAERGLVYTDAHATSSWTWPSTASMLTGMLPEEHGVVDTSSCYLGSRFVTLPEVLRQSGYATTCFSGNPLISPRRNFQQGFDSFLVDKNFRPTEDLMPRALAWMEAHQDERFFMYMQLVDTHDPYKPMELFERGLNEQAPPDYPYTAVINYGRELRRQYAKDPEWENWAAEAMPPAAQEHMSNLYDACVESADYGVGQLVNQLQALGLTKKTLVVFTSDHGDEFLDHGLLSHGQSLHAELTRVPLLFAGPGVSPGRVSRAVSNRNLAYTLAQLGGADIGRSGESQDLLKPDSLDDRAVFLSSNHGIRDGGHTPLLGVRKDGWLYSIAPEAGGAHVREELYNTTVDAMELVNLADIEVDKLRALQAIVQRRLERSKEIGPKQGFEAGDTTLEFFQKIGYSGD